MATFNLGAIKFNWKGAYNNSTAYVVDDVVSSGGSSYICILASQGNAVSNGTYWQQMSAAGTNGTRRIGKYCRVMIHSVIGGNAGGLHDLKNEMREIQNVQDMYIDALCAETKFTKKKLKELFAKNVNIYLSAEEAVEYGIADIIV